MNTTKENALKRLEFAYQRLIITEGEYETGLFKKAFDAENKDLRRLCISDFSGNIKGVVFLLITIVCYLLPPFKFMSLLYMI